MYFNTFIWIACYTAQTNFLKIKVFKDTNFGMDHFDFSIWGGAECTILKKKSYIYKYI